MNSKTKAPKQTIEEKLTQRIIELIETNSTEVGLDWAKIGLRAMHNANGKPYNLMNSMLLSDAASDQGYKNTQWLTFNQVKEKGGSVKGQKSSLIVLTFPSFEKNADGSYKYDEAGEKIIRGFYRKGVNVFNIEQTGLEADKNYAFTIEENEDLELSKVTQSLVDNFPTPIEFSGQKAFYSPTRNTITLPEVKLFTSEAAIFSTAAHECAHSTGQEGWLNREGITNFDSFGSKQYAKEELIAELAAALTCMKVGSEYKVEHHANYLKSWLEALKEDPKFILNVMNDATKASDEILKYIDESTYYNQENQSEVSEDKKTEEKLKFGSGVSEEEFKRHLVGTNFEQARKTYGQSAIAALMTTDSLTADLENISGELSEDQVEFIEKTKLFISQNTSNANKLVLQLKKKIISGEFEEQMQSDFDAAMSDKTFQLVDKYKPRSKTKGNSQSM